MTQEGERGGKYDWNHPKRTRVQRTYAKDCLCKIRFVGYLKHFAFTTDWALGDFCEVTNTKNDLGSPDNQVNQVTPANPTQMRRKEELMSLIHRSFDRIHGTGSVLVTAAPKSTIWLLEEEAQGISL